MNERIEELAQECFIMGEKEFAGKPVGFNYKKFAELIVRECLDISHRESHLPNAVLFDERSDKFIKDIHNRVSRATREHFGVEE